MNEDALIPVERIERAILLIRGQKVLLDVDLAELYGVETRILTRAVRRNIERFPPDFAFQLSSDEWANLKSQFGISSQWGGRRTPPFAFTEQGVAMLSSVLRSERAVRVNVAIMRAFVRLRQVLATHDELARKLADLEGHVTARLHEHDEQLRIIFEAIQQLMDPGIPGQRRIGFTSGEDDE